MIRYENTKESCGTFVYGACFAVSYDALSLTFELGERTIRFVYVRRIK